MQDKIKIKKEILTSPDVNRDIIGKTNKRGLIDDDLLASCQLSKYCTIKYDVILLPSVRVTSTLHSLRWALGSAERSVVLVGCLE